MVVGETLASEEDVEVLTVERVLVRLVVLAWAGRVGRLMVSAVVGGLLDEQPAYQHAAIEAGSRTEGKCLGQIQNCLFFQ